LVGIATLLAMRLMPLPEASTEPMAEIALPPAMIKLDPVPEPLETGLPAPVVQQNDIGRPAAAAQRPHRAVRRRIKAEPTRVAYSDVVQGQAGEASEASNISAEAMAIALMPAPMPVVAEPSRPAVNPSAQVVRGKTVQMGVYKTHRQAEIAWRSAIKDYTYLVTMPRSIQPIRIRSKLYYRLQLGTPSRTHARQLCGNLRQIGRSCTVA
jgi:hypothetical protein